MKKTLNLLLLFIATNTFGTGVLGQDTTLVRANSEDQSATESIEVGKLSSEELTNVDITIIGGENYTSIIVHKDGDTIKNYEMNFDFPEEGGLKEWFEDFFEKNESPFPLVKKKKKRFRGHWSGFEFGLNNYLTDDFSMTPEQAYMEINSGKSWNFNLNFAQFSIPLIGDRFGLVSGLGLEWSNYHFSNKNTIRKNLVNHSVTPKDLSAYALKKNRLQTTYLTVPLLMELQMGGDSRDRCLSLSGGLIAGLKLGSHTKYKSSDTKQKTKDDFYLQLLRYGFTSRVHYGNVGLFFNYYNGSLFLDQKGPELYPFAAGVIISFH